MSKLSLAQTHGIASFWESLLVGAGPLIVSVAGFLLSLGVWFAIQAANCTTVTTGMPGPGICSAPGATKVIPAFLVLWPFLQWLLSGVIRGVQGFLITKHAPVVEMPASLADHPATPTSASVQSVILVKPAAPSDPTARQGAL